jgi:DNA (cytosine-5)-methyltransferase 1
MTAYYNEIEPYAAQWLRNLIKEGHIADGEVDTRSIVDVQPVELAGYTQCHFFAGIGGWSHALRLAGWPDDRPIWTGSAPCQPFSVAGKGAGTDDSRHLWPHFHRLISTCRPPVVMGEQVAGKAGYGWLDGVRADLAREDYASRGVDIPACAVDAPHIRQRLYWVAEDMGDTNSGGRGEDWERRGVAEVHRPRTHAWVPTQERGAVRVGDVGDANNAGLEGQLRHGDGGSRREGEARPVAEAGGSHMADASGQRCEGVGLLRDGRSEVPEASGASESDMADAASGGWGQGFADAGGMQEGDRSQGPTGRSPQHDSASFWSDHIWLTGSDGKSRRVKPGIRLLAHGVPARVGKLRSYGNAIVPQVAAEVIRAYVDAMAPSKPSTPQGCNP